MHSRKVIILKSQESLHPYFPQHTVCGMWNEAHPSTQTVVIYEALRIAALNLVLHSLQGRSVDDKLQGTLRSHTNKVFHVSCLSEILLIIKRIFGQNNDTAGETKTNKKADKEIH